MPVRYYTLTMLHASRLSQGTPVGADLGEVCQLQSHAQRDLAESSMIVLHELYDLLTLLGGELVVLEQVTFAEDLTYTQDLVTSGV